MDTKFTIRDFLVYFLTGLTFILFLFPIRQHHLIIGVTKEIKDVFGGNFETWKALALIPVIYLLGHLIYCLDIMKLEIAKKIKPKKDNNFLKKWIYYVLVGERVSGVLFFEFYSIDH